MKILGRRQKKAHIMEIQLKVNFARDNVQRNIPDGAVCFQNEMINIIGVTKGHRYKGVTSKWYTEKLPRQTHKGLKKVASKIQFTITRADQKSYHHRPEINKESYRMGAGYAMKEGKLAENSAPTVQQTIYKTSPVVFHIGSERHSSWPRESSQPVIRLLTA